MSKDPNLHPIGEPDGMHPMLYLDKPLVEHPDSTVVQVDYDALSELYDDLGLQPGGHSIVAMDNDFKWHSHRRRQQQIGVRRTEPFMELVVTGAVRLSEAAQNPEYYANTKRNSITFAVAMTGTFAASVALKSAELFGATALTTFGGAIVYDSQWKDVVEPERRKKQEALYQKYAGAIVFKSLPKRQTIA